MCWAYALPLCVCEMWSVFTTFFQMKELKLRVVKKLAQGDSQEMERWDSNPCLTKPKGCSLLP